MTSNDVLHDSCCWKRWGIEQKFFSTAARRRSYCASVFFYDVFPPLIDEIRDGQCVESFPFNLGVNPLGITQVPQVQQTMPSVQYSQYEHWILGDLAQLEAFHVSQTMNLFF